MALLKHGQKYLSKGLSIIPCRLYLDEATNKVKKPATVNWIKYQKKQVTNTVLMTQWKKKIEDGLAIITGEISDLLVVDVDTKSSMNEIKPFIKGVKTVTVRTPSGGWHIYFKYRDGLNTTAGLDHDGLDIRAEGGYVVAPPSKYPNGKLYRFIKGYEFGKIDIAPMPEELFAHLMKLKKERKGQGDGKKEKPQRNWFLDMLHNGVNEGARTTKMVEAIGYMIGRKIPKDMIKAVIKNFNKTLSDPLTEKELRTEVLPSINRIAKDVENRVVEELNEIHSLVVLENGDRVISEKFKDYKGKQKLRFSKMQHVRESYINKTELINKKPECVFDIWRTHPNKKIHKGVIFNPSKSPWEDSGFINLWRGIPMKPKRGDWSKFKWHIENIISPEYSEWILQWMAHIVQRPGGPRPGTVIVMRGGQGIGKGTFANIFGSIFGEMEYFFRVSKISDLTGKFNDDLKTAILLHIDEATWGGDKEAAGVLKSLVTEPTRRIEPKGINAFHVDNYLNLIISSNNRWVVPSGAQERRFFVIDILDTKQGDWDYFNAIHTQMYKEGGLEAMYYDLMYEEYDLKTISKIPDSIGTTDQIIRSLTIEEEFWFERLTIGTMVDSHRYWKYVCVYDKFYAQYEDFCTSKNVKRGRAGRQLLGTTLKTLCPEIENSQPKRRDGSRYRCKKVPSLEKCRKYFNDKFGIKNQFPDVFEPSGITESARNSDEEGSFYPEFYL